MLDTSNNVLFPGYNHLLTIGMDDSLIINLAGADNQSVGSSRLVVIAGGYDREIGHF